MDAGGFQRFEKAAGEPQRDAVLVPELLAPAGREAQEPRLRQRLAVQVGQQRGRRLIVADEAAAIDIAVADAMLQRNAPLPAGLARRGARVGRQGAGALAGHRHRPIAGQPMGPVLVSGLQRLLDQQPAKARTVDEQIRLDPLAVIQLQRANESVLAAQFDIHDLALDPHARRAPARSRANIPRTGRHRNERRRRTATTERSSLGAAAGTRPQPRGDAC